MIIIQRPSSWHSPDSPPIFSDCPWERRCLWPGPPIWPRALRATRPAPPTALSADSISTSTARGPFRPSAAFLRRAGTSSTGLPCPWWMPEFSSGKSHSNLSFPGRGCRLTFGSRWSSNSAAQSSSATTRHSSSSSIEVREPHFIDSLSSIDPNSNL